MGKIHLTTAIHAPAKKVFDLSRNINLHRIFSSANYETALEAITTGLIKENETVTWQAKYLLKKRDFTLKITSMEMPLHFTTQLLERGFKNFRHEHYFKAFKNGTFLIDVVEFESSYGLIGKWIEKLFLTSYIHNLLLQRNEVIKQYAEKSKQKVIVK
jgi:ligand-binding SRPBCC domain-containing protein